MTPSSDYPNHLHFHCIEAKQGEFTSIFAGVLKFRDLSPLFTATPRIPRSDDPFYDENPNPPVQWPQRPEKKHRLNAIAEFVEKRLANTSADRKLTIFPSTVILGLLTDIEEHDEIPEHPTPSAAHLLPQNGSHSRTILLPRKEASLFVIDGQHRLKGINTLKAWLTDDIAAIKKLTGLAAENKKNELETSERLLARLLEFDVLVSLLVDFDLKEQALVFADVNFNQKPVARSFYYDIFGTFESEDFTSIGFCHDLALHLNNSDASPLKGMIKLLGSGPGLISQAFFVARFILLIDPEKTFKSSLRHFFLERQKGNTSASRQVGSIVRNYFAAVRDEFEYAWPVQTEGKYSTHNYSFILCKSMVMSGLLALLSDIYRLMLLDFAMGRESEIGEGNILTPDLFADFFKKIDPEGRALAANSIFSKKSVWGIGGSAVLERRIYESLRSKVFEAYREMSDLPECSYQKLCAQFDGDKRALQLAKEFNAESEKEFWKKVEVSCDGEWSKNRSHLAKLPEGVAIQATLPT